MSKNTNNIIQICTHKEFELFKSIHEGLAFLFDGKADKINSAYSYKQTEVFEKAKDFWPRLEQICEAVNISLEIDLKEFKNAVFGFEPFYGQKAEAICCNSPYIGMPMSKVMLLEEEHLKRVAKRNLDKVMLHLRKYVSETDERISEAKRQKEKKQKNLTLRQSTWIWIKRIPRWIFGLIVAVFVAVIAGIIVDIFADLGLLDIIKSVIYRIAPHK